MTKDAKISSEEQITGFLQDKDNKKYHYNDYEELEYKIPSGSLNLDLALGGGLPAGVHRFTGVNEGGKTSCALAFARNFQQYFKKDGKVIYIKSEGRLTSDLVARAGIDIAEDKFFKFDCNVFEKVFRISEAFSKPTTMKTKSIYLLLTA